MLTVDSQTCTHMTSMLTLSQESSPCSLSAACWRVENPWEVDLRVVPCCAEVVGCYSQPAQLSRRSMQCCCGRDAIKTLFTQVLFVFGGHDAVSGTMTHGFRERRGKKDAKHSSKSQKQHHNQAFL
jgi:hypothetical protein